MGMFDKDKEIGIILPNWIDAGEPFIIWGAKIKREDYPTNIGPAVQTEMEVSKIDSPGDRYEVTTLASAIGAKVREAEVSDFPAVVSWGTVRSSFGNDATVLHFLKPYGNQATTTGDTPPATETSGF